MILILLESDKIYSLRLPEKVSGKYYLEHINVIGKSEQILTAEGIDGRWVLNTTAYGKFLDNEQFHYAENGVLDIQINRTLTRATLLVESDESAYGSFFKRSIKGDCDIRIGVQAGSTIRYDENRFPLMSKCSLLLRYSDGKYSVAECMGKVYINGMYGHCGDVDFGTQIFVGGVKIIIGKDFICGNYNDSVVYINENLLGVYKSPEREPRTTHEIAEDKADNLFYCSPRFCRENERIKINIEVPPSKTFTDTAPAIFSIGPSLTMGMASVATAGVTVANNISNGGSIGSAAPTLIMAGSMVLGSVMWPLLSKGAEKRRNKKKEQLRTVTYAEYIKTLRNRIDCISDEQRKNIIAENPEMEELLHRIEYRERRLWERVSEQKDFISFTAGKGNVETEIDISFNAKNFSMEKDPLYDLAAELVKDNPIITDVPISVSLRDDFILGVIGEQNCTYSFVRDIIMQIAALHSYAEVHFVVICSNDEYYKWEYLRWIPHIYSHNSDLRYICTDTEDMKLVSSELEKEMAQGTDHAYIVISCDRNLASKTSLVSKILSMDKYNGFSLIAVYDEMKYLPKECRSVISVEENSAEIHNSDGTVRRVELNKHMTEEECKNSVLSLANIRLASSDKSYELPNMITFMELMGAQQCEHLNCIQRWKDNNPVNSLKAPIGIDENGDICYLDLHQEAHGPHGLVAGMTGSGKSEFIMTYILSMALNYSPEEVSFILIDYKGGGMSKAFSKLPHLAGMITNLDGSGISRALVSIESELKRREHIFSKTGEKLEMSNLDIYKYQKLYRSGLVSEPMSHLFIISDEFAELKSQQPEFMEKLISTARIGRSLGVHLILATQKPSGVVSDQIWSNSRFKVCLKVQDAADSSDMIKRPDAAELTKTGRYYLQVGYNELFLMGQSAWCGAVYRPDKSLEMSSDVGISVIDHCGRKIAQSSAVNLKASKNKENIQNTSSKELDVVLNYISQTAENESLKARPLWLAPLPTEMFLEDISRYPHNEHQTGHYADIAVYDAPEKQEQGVLELSPMEDGNIALYGTAGSGKLSFITSMICSMAVNYSPKQVNFYIIDFGAETLMQFRDLPHVGEVIIPATADRINNLLIFLKRQAEKRKQILLEYGGDYHAYCENNTDIPEIIVIINDFGAFNEYMNGLFDTSYLQLKKYGICFVVTASQINSIGFSALQSFGRKVAFQLNDEGYSIVLSKSGRLRPEKCKGRGLAQIGEKVYEFQTAFVCRAEEQTAYIENLCIDQRKKHGAVEAVKVPMLPQLFNCRYLCDNALSPMELSSIPVGLSAIDVEPVYFDLTSKYTVISHKNMFDSSMIQGVAELLGMVLGNNLVVIDIQEAFADSEKQYTYVRGIEQSVNYAKKIFDEGLYRHNHYNDCVRSGNDAPEYESKMFMFCGLSKLLNSISGELKSDFIDMLNQVGDKHNYRYLIYDPVSNINSISSMVSSFAERSNQKNYIWVGDGYSEQYVFPMLRPKNKAEDIIGGGYVVKSRRIECVKLICSDTVKENEDE